MSEGELKPLTTTGKAAQRYLERGWSILPVEARGKRPLVPWQALQTTAPSADEVARWFHRWPDANVAIVTGAISGLVVLDVDAHHGGVESLAALETRWGPLPSTMEVITGSGGKHFYFAHPLQSVRNRAGIAKGIDLRGDGGYVVAPPSVHPNGRTYRWASARSPEDRSPAALPQWLMTIAGTRPVGRPVTEWRKLVQEGVTEGVRNSTIASLTGHLLWHGVDEEIAMELMLAWNRLRCRPPLDDAEVAQVVQSITRLHEN